MIHDLAGIFPSLTDPAVLGSFTTGPSALHTNLARESEALTILLEVLHELELFTTSGRRLPFTREIELLWHADETDGEKLRRSHELAHILIAAFATMGLDNTVAVRGSLIGQEPKVVVVIDPQL